MISLYRPGTSVLHRLPAGIKLLALAVLALGIAIYPHDAVSVLIVLAGVVLAYVAAGMPPAVLLRQLWQLRLIIIALAVFLAVFVSPLTAWISVVRVVAIVLLAGLLTLTTRMGDLLEVLHRLLTPLARFGVNPDAVAMTISLCLAMVPVIAGHASALRQAQQARGLRLGVGVVVPLLVAALRHADDVGDALAARGLG